MDKEIFRGGHAFSSAFVVSGYIFLAGGLCMIIFGGAVGFVLGFIPILVGSIWCLTHKEFALDYQNRRAKSYFSFLILDFGSWKMLDDFRFITVLKFQLVEESVTSTDIATNEYTFYEYRLTFLSENHLNKWPALSSTDEEKVNLIKKAVIEKLGLPETIYNPPTSAHARRH